METTDNSYRKGLTICLHSINIYIKQMKIKTNTEVMLIEMQLTNNSVLDFVFKNEGV